MLISIFKQETTSTIKCVQNSSFIVSASTLIRTKYITYNHSEKRKNTSNHIITIINEEGFLEIMHNILLKIVLNLIAFLTSHNESCDSNCITIMPVCIQLLYIFRYDIMYYMIGTVNWACPGHICWTAQSITLRFSSFNPSNVFQCDPFHWI